MLWATADACYQLTFPSMMAKNIYISTLCISILALSACAGETQTPTTEQNAYAEQNGSQTTENTSINNNEMTPSAQTGQNTNADLQLRPPSAGEKIAVIETDLGTIKFKLFTELAPEMTKNFETLANSGKYNNVPFHRVIKDFMIQTGDFTQKNGMGGYSYKGPGTELPDEITPALKHLYGTVSMANHGKDTNGSQFFIVTNKNGTSFLDGGYTVFGQVYEGMDVAEKIADLQVAGTEAPGRVINMKKVTVSTYAP
jgi:peptidyl-prolyl cis-trans isomerase B (cyclophilin B)